MKSEFHTLDPIAGERTIASPSPLNGERVGARGEPAIDHSLSSNASAASLVSPVAHFPNVARVFAGRSRLFRAPSERLSVVNSKNAVFQYYASSNNRRVRHLLPVVREIRADRRPVRGCNAPRHKTNQGNVCRPDAGGGICKPRTSGRGELPTIFSPPKWISCGGGGEFARNSLPMGVVGEIGWFKRYFAFSPLALTLSPLRGEGIADGSPTLFCDVCLATIVVLQNSLATC